MKTKRWLSMLLCVILIACTIPTTAGFAAPVAFSTYSGATSFDTGTGADGAYIVSMNGTQARYSRNGGSTWTNIASTAKVIPAGYNEFSAVDRTIYLVPIELIKTNYDGISVTWDVTNLTVNSGVVLTTNNVDHPTVINATGTILINTGGGIMSRAGNGGNGGASGPGAESGQSVTLNAAAITISDSAFLTAGGGGGGKDEGGTSTATPGGAAGSVTVNASTLTINGELRGAFGGGGGDQDGSYSSPGNPYGGAPGTVTVTANNVNGTGIIASSMGGSDGSGTWGGCGAGGGGGYSGYWGGAATFDRGHYTFRKDALNLTGAELGVTTIEANAIDLRFLMFYAPYSSLSSSGVVNINTNTLTDSSTINWDHFGTTNGLSVDFKVRVKSTPITAITSTVEPTAVKKLHTLVNNASTTAKTLTNLYLGTSISYRATDLNVTGCTLSSTSLSNTSGRIDFLNGTIAASSSVTSGADVSLTDVTSSTNLTINGTKYMNPVPMIGFSSLGANEITLADWGVKYVSSGVAINGLTYPADFKVETSSDGSTWAARNAVALFSGPSAVWRDTLTKEGQLTYYRVGFKSTTSPHYIWDYSKQMSIVSQGSDALDEVPPSINLFQVAQGEALVSISPVLVELQASDGRTAVEDLQAQVQVGSNFYTWNGTQFVPSTVSDYSTFNVSMTGLPIPEGNNLITVRVKDQTGNIATKSEYIKYVKLSGSSVAPNVTESALGEAINVTLPIKGGISAGVEIIDGQETYVVGSNVVSIAFDMAKLPANIRGMKYSISADAYSEELPVASSLTIQLPPLAGVHMVKMGFVSTDGIKSTVPTPLYIAFDKDAPIVTATSATRATVVSGTSVSVQLDVKDDVSTVFMWSLDSVSWSDVPADGIVSVPLSGAGYKTMTLYVKDSAGRVTPVKFGIYKVAMSDMVQAA